MDEDSALVLVQSVVDPREQIQPWPPSG